jgi:hypothetical protein
MWPGSRRAIRSSVSRADRIVCMSLMSSSAFGVAICVDIFRRALSSDRTASSAARMRAAASS